MTAINEAGKNLPWAGKVPNDAIQSMIHSGKTRNLQGNSQSFAITPIAAIQCGFHLSACFEIRSLYVLWKESPSNFAIRLLKVTDVT